MKNVQDIDRHFYLTHLSIGAATVVAVVISGFAIRNTSLAVGSCFVGVALMLLNLVRCIRIRDRILKGDD